MPLLFAYGTLQIADIQLATFGRFLRGETDEAIGCEKHVITIQDPDVIAATGRAEHLNLRFGGDPNRTFVMGHSAGAYIAAMLAINGRYLHAVGLDPHRHFGADANQHSSVAAIVRV